MTYVSGHSRVLQHLQLWWLKFPWCPSCWWVTGSEFLLQLDTTFQYILVLQINVRTLCTLVSWAVVSSQLVDMCQTLTYVNSWKYGMCGISTRQFKLLLQTTRPDSPTSSSQFFSNGCIELEGVGFPVICHLVARKFT